MQDAMSDTGLTKMATSAHGRNRQVKVARRAVGVPGPEVFELADAAAPACPEAGVLAEVLFASVDPGMRGWLSAETNYMTVPDGAVMRAQGVARILESRAPGWAEGDLVYGWFGWQQYAAVQVEDLLWKIDPEVAPPEAWLGELGLNGLTAWVGFQHLASPKAGETIVVSTAAGAVGSVVGQLARAAGLRCVGLTSSSAKAQVALAEFGYDAMIDYKTAEDLQASVARACPNGVDIFFDNTAGSIADAVFPHLNQNARVVQCGTASVSNWLSTPTGPRRERDMIVKRLRWQGFIVFDHVEVFPDAFEALKALYRTGGLSARHEILPGLEQAPTALRRLYEGENLGRLMIRP